MRHILIKLALLVSTLVAFAAGAQTPNAANLKLMTQGDVNAIVVQPDGKVVVGGSFTRVAGVDRRNLARLNTDGTVDLTWDPSPDGVVRALSIDGTQIVVGGNFGVIAQAGRTNLAKIDIATGAATAFATGTNGTVFALAIDGTTLYVGGEFSIVGGQSRLRLAAMDLSTGTVNAFTASPDGIVHALAVSGNSVYLGGIFTTVSATARGKLAAVDKSTGVLIDSTPAANGDVYALAMDGTNLLLGGAFTTLGAATRERLAAIDTASGAVTAWNPGADGNVLALRVEGNNVYVAGQFATVATQPRARLAAVDRTMGTVLPWNPGANSTVRTVVRSSSRTYVGGAFDTAAGVRRLSFAAIDDAATNVAGWSHVGRPGAVHALKAQGDNRVVVGGDFLIAHDAAGVAYPRAYLLRLEADSSLDLGWAAATDQVVYALAFDTSTVYAGGAFANAGGLPRQRLAAFDINTGAVKAWNPGTNGIVLALALALDGGTVYAGGEFTSAGGQARAHLAAFDTAGALLAWNPGTNDTVTALGINHGDVIAGGHFSSAAGTARTFLAAFAGATAANAGSLLPLATPVSGAVTAIHVDTDNILYIGGSFNRVGGIIHNAIAAIDLVTGAPTQWTTQTANVNSIVKRGAIIYVGGLYPRLGGDIRNNIGAVDATSGLASFWDPATNASVRAIAVVDSRVIVGGLFTAAKGVLRDGLVVLPAIIQNTSPLVVTVNGPGKVTGAYGSINCGTDCYQDVQDGTTILLETTPQPGAKFVGWSGDKCSGPAVACQFYMASPVNVTATFSNVFTVSANVISVNGGQGRVVSDPAGIDCGGDCTEDFAYNATVTFTAVPTGTSIFTGWDAASSCASAGTGPCTLTIDGNKSVLATFAQGAPLLVNVSGPGRVTSNPAGIDCSPTCAKTFPIGTVVTFTATPDAGQIFVGWSGACNGTAPTCTVTLNAFTSVNAAFAAAQPIVATGVFGGGRVVSTPAGIDCHDPACSTMFPFGTAITLQAVPDAGMAFDHWDGDCQDDGATCTFTLNADILTRAYFVPVQPASPKSDFNADGKSDLVWRNTDGRVAVWLMDGSTTLSNAEIFPAGTAWQVAHIADLNGDGKSDLVWQNPDGRITVYLMDGTTAVTKQLILPAGPWTVTQAADLDGDGKADLVFQNTDGTIAAWLMDGVAMKAGSTLLSAGTGWSVTKTGDFDGDGKADLLWTHADGRVAIWLMDGLTVKSTNQILNAGTGWTVTHVADFDGDGKSDLLWQNTDGSIAVWLMNGSAMASGSGLLGAGTGWSVTRTGDFNGDGKADLFFLHTDGRAAIYLMNGLVPTQTTQILNAGGGWSAKRVQDMNGDGKADIVWENVDGRAAVWLMNGTAMVSGSEIIGPATGWSVSPVSP
ncbi:hypothetical protein BWI17_13110 [Betaproteobacteria bacterium GR16-43]|nr:hypothetical protein BWI17_13110 [Betaproteobacteria bacterium GR16-43]